MSLKNIGHEHLLRAIEKLNRLGRNRFLEAYRCDPAQSYFLVHNGQRYDSEGIRYETILHPFRHPSTFRPFDKLRDHKLKVPQSETQPRYARL